MDELQYRPIHHLEEDRRPFASQMMDDLLQYVLVGRPRVAENQEIPMQV
jgi:hypothetical protein